LLRRWVHTRVRLDVCWQYRANCVRVAALTQRCVTFVRPLNIGPPFMSVSCERQ
jgi:hypothetical protein